MPDEDVIRQLGLMSPIALIKWSRLCLFSRIASKAPIEIFCVLASLSSYDKSWIHAVSSDLKWLCNHPVFEECEGWDMLQWRQAVATDPKKFRKELTIFCRSAFANLSLHWA
eukprot:8897538-Karenia_brevis.AAC.1